MGNLPSSLQCVMMMWLNGLLLGFTESRCVGQACSPPMGNLASGRTLLTLSSCYANTSSCLENQANYSEDLHPPGLMADDPFLYPDTWWASTVAFGQPEEIRLDLEKKFYMSHVVMSFHSPRPAAMRLERSQDFGQTWDTLKLFASNCSEMFGLLDDVRHPGAICTSRYSSALPCSRGEIIFRSIGLGSWIVDPYSPEALARLTVTNLKIQLLKSQKCPVSKGQRSTLEPSLSSVDSVSGATASSDSSQFAVYSLLAKGTCLCHGHAEHCLPENERLESLQDSHVGSVCVPITQQAITVRGALHSTMTNPGELPMVATGTVTHARSVIVMGTHKAATSPGECGSPLGAAAAVSVTTASTTLLAAGAIDVDMDTIATLPETSSRPTHVPGVGVMLLVLWPHQLRLCHGAIRGVGSAIVSLVWEEPPAARHWGFCEEGCKPCLCALTCDPITGHCLDSSVRFHSVPLGGKIPELSYFKPQEEEGVWPIELAVSALYYTGKCSCKEAKLKNVADLCQMKHSYVIKGSVLSAHDKGTHAVVLVKVRKVFRSGKLGISQGTHTLYPLSWTRRGCTCPILNPGASYLLAGSEEVSSGRLLVTMQSLVIPWSPALGFQVTEALHRGCM
ncbi:hypothetical protein DNTS_035277 [Danionella cerebrum]|uniref:Netrin-1 n=1 Tax=Danionella cerebrum TaxID=2873325 RepID=A0A553N368_9TELE|nr:hypothetical protein DNTS_035277 [Danionella translucida]